MKKLLILLILILFPSISLAAITLPWSTTFNCPADVIYNTPTKDNYPGCTDFNEILYSSAFGIGPMLEANRPGGGGGRGLRITLGSGDPSNAGGYSRIIFATPQTEFYIRYWQKYTTGFAWDAAYSTAGFNTIQQKQLYLYVGSTPSFCAGMPSTGNYNQAEWQTVANGNLFQPICGQPGCNLHCNIDTNCGWDTVMAGGAIDPNTGHHVSDGNWFAIEYHIKSDTNGSNGIWEYWLNGVLKAQYTNLNYGGAVFSYFLLPDNSKGQHVTGAMYHYIDDIAVSNTGPIGIGGGGDITPPVISNVSPSGQLPAGTTSTTISFNTDENATCKMSNTNIPYASMTNSLVGDGTTYHYTGFGPIVDGASYTEYIACMDTAGNISGNTVVSFSVATQGSILFSESFDNNSFTARGWYDGATGTVDTVNYLEGTGSLKCHFLIGGTHCNPADGEYTLRKKFTPTDSIYVSYWVKHSANWIGDTDPNHPHIFFFLTNLETDYNQPARTHMTTYVEENQGFPYMAIQDGQNIDETKIGIDLTSTTENRAVAGCNGVQNVGQDATDCYLSGTVHNNDIKWKAPTAYFFAADKTDWHHVEALFQMNTISGGKGNADGIVRYWHDGTLVIDHSNVIFRTAQNPTMQFTQIMLSPFFANASTVDQTIWFDNLVVYNTTQVSSYTVTGTAGTGGTISPLSYTSVPSGSIKTFTITPDTNYTASVGGTCGGVFNPPTYTTNPIVADCTVAATFTSVSTHTVTPSSSSGGSITPSVAQTVTNNGYTTFTISPNTGYSYVVDGTCPGSLSGYVYTAGPITSNCTVTVTYSAIPTSRHGLKLGTGNSHRLGVGGGDISVSQ